MKNKTFFIIVSGLITTGVMLAALQFSPTSASAELSKEEAKEKVAAKFSGEIVEFELDDNEKIYEVELEETDREYELKVDAETGEIISLEESERKNDKDQEVTTVSLSDNQTDSKHDAENQESSFISREEAKTIATEKYYGTVVEAELDEDDGSYYYEMEIWTDKGEVDLKINARSGEIVYISVDEDDKLSSEVTISADEARSIAKGKYEGTIQEFELDEDDGRYMYELEMRTDKGELELEIDANNGEIMKVEYDD
ncbi:PepSY domain-containing protein [Gracilibacillus saliphilus]|uniref:PepSY domain-containing protein n=1 Tax=Gracilibacillus saliphilus TaxID=543890 RepID=UPI0013D59F49|nr:PepSY domain-containing protein [Gracilibacillus saliphilus]